MSTIDSNDNAQMLADSARKYVERGYSEVQRAISSQHPDGCHPGRWQEFADLGWLAWPAALAVGAALGALTGAIHAFAKVPSFIVSLGMWYVGLGIAAVLFGYDMIPFLSNAAWVAARPSQTGIWQSIRTRSMSPGSARRSNAAWPSPAMLTRRPMFSSMKRTSFWLIGLSSATRIDSAFSAVTGAVAGGPLGGAVGSVAGDDTVMVATPSVEAALRVQDLLLSLVVKAEKK